MLTKKITGLVIVLGFLAVSSVQASSLSTTTVIDPQYYVGSGAGTACAIGCAGDPNRIFGNTLDLYIPSSNTAGSTTLLILGIPNFSGAAPTINSVTKTTNYPSGSTTTLPSSSFGLGGTNVYVASGGLGWNPSTGFVGSYTPTTAGSVYNFIGLVPPTDASENTSNWFGPQEVAAFGSTPTSFGLYVYSINAQLPGQGLFNIQWNGSGLSNGTIAIAYSLNTSSGHTFSTPWTVAGQVGQVGPVVPEPGTLLLLGTGLIGLAGVARRRLHRNK